MPTVSRKHISKKTRKMTCPSQHTTAFKTSFGGAYCPTCEKNITVEEYQLAMQINE